MPPLVAFAPWIALTLYLLIKVRLPRPLPEVGVSEKAAPLVSVIVPARNEERSIRSCVESICGSDYPEFEVIVVDDRSDDSTLDLARAIPTEPRPEGRGGRGPGASRWVDGQALGVRSGGPGGRG